MAYKGDLEKLAKAWIELQHLNDRPGIDALAREPYEWASDQIIKFLYFKPPEPEALWALILDVLARDCSPPVMVNLAAGPMEDLLAYHGPDFIDRVERQARRDVKLRSLLGGVWQRDTMSEEVWRRVEAARGRPW